jgi:hypothetical protein
MNLIHQTRERDTSVDERDDGLAVAARKREDERDTAPETREREAGVNLV